MRILFFYGGGFNHGDAGPFDGEGGILAHTLGGPPPNVFGDQAGDIHFDDSETWTLDNRPNSAQPIDLVTVAAHEIGHALGLDHTTVSGSLMLVNYTGSHRFLGSDDLAGIRSLYGLPQTTIICTSDTLVIQDQPAGTTLNWSSSNPNGLAINATTGVASRQNNFNGQVTITATIDSGCGTNNIARNVWGGYALIEDILYPSNTVAPYQFIPLSIITPPGSSNGYYKAEIIRIGGGYSNTIYSNVMEFSLPMTGTFNVKVYAYNACGWPQNFYPLVFFCSEDGGMFAVYPNPVSETLTIESKDQYRIDSGQTTNELTNDISYRFYDPNSGSIVAEGNLSAGNGAEINVSKLSKGKYILKIQIDKDKEETHHIIVE